jgi:hypothetical protein
MTERQYWFARYRLPPNVSKGLVPVRWQGYAVIGAFVVAMVLGGLSMLLFGLQDHMFYGILSFAVLALAGGSLFIGSAVRMSDPNHTIDDYRAGRVPGHNS